MTNPFGAIFTAPAAQQSNPFGELFGASAEPDLSTGMKRQDANRQSLVDMIGRLKSITPANEGHKARLDRLIQSAEMQLSGKEAGSRSGLENFIRGTAAGATSGLEFPVELAGDVANLFGNHTLSKYIEENRALIQEDLDPRGKAGVAGEIAGGIIGSAPGAGGIAEGVGKTAVRLAPSSRIARAIAAASEGTMGQRVASNVITGLPVNAAMAVGAADMEIPEGATPEEAARIRDTNVANKIKNLAIGIGADALFGMIPHGGKKTDAAPAAEVKPADVPLTPERQAQLDLAKAQTAVKATAKRRERIDKQLAQSEWQILNPDLEWKEIQPDAKRKIYDSYKERRRNTNLNTSAAGNPPEMAAQLVSMEEQLKAVRGERDDARRLAETDTKLNVGNDRALQRAAAKADADPNQVYIFTDVNGLKDINDSGGMEAGDRLLTDARDALVNSISSYGVKPRVFRYGGDELVAIVPKEHAETILSKAEGGSIKTYGDKTGSLSGAIHNTLADALSVEGKAKLTSRKLEAKAKQNIPGRSPEEQSMIDAVRERINTAPPPEQAVVELPPPLPHEVMATIAEVRGAGGLQTDESMRGFTEELTRIYNTDMTPDARASELQSLVEDFTPFEAPKVDSGEHPNEAGLSPEDKARLESMRRIANATNISRDMRDEAKDQIGRILGDGPMEKIEPKASPVAATPEPVAEPVSTRLQAVEHNKPLEKMSEKELGVLDDKVLDAIESVEKDSPEYKVLQKDLDTIGEVRARAKGVEPKPAEVAPEPRQSYSDPAFIKAEGGPGKRDIADPQIASDVARIRRSSPRKLSDADLDTYISDHEQVRRSATTLDEARDAQSRLDKALEERAIRAKASNATMPEVQRSAIQGSAGFAFGFASDPNDPDHEDRTTNGLMWAGIAAVGGLAIARMHAKARLPEIKVEPSDHWPGSAVADKKIVHYSDIEEPSISWRERAREWYQGIVRRTYAMDRAVDALTGNSRGASSLPAHKNPAKLASMFGRWVSMAEGALMDKPVYVDYAGNVVPLPAKSFREIAASVDGDLKGLGKLMTARTSIEGEGLRSVPLDPTTSDLIFHNAPEKYHKAADDMRAFDLSMASVLEQAGVLKPGSVKNFAMEQFYAALKKVFDPDSGPSKIVRDPKTRKLVISPNPVKGRKHGTSTQVYNPVETSVSMVPQIYRAAELNNIKNRLVDLWEAGGKPDHILKQVERRKQPVSVDQQLRVDALKQEITGMDNGNAESLIAAFDPKSLDPRSNVMTVYREGTLRAYRVDEDIAQSMAALTPDELEGLWKVLGLPAGVARQGVVLNPYFVAKQAFIDGWQATLNSQYGFRPGIDQFIGWSNIVRHTPEYKQFIAAGGGHSTLQSHDYANVKTALSAVARGGGGPLETAVKQARDFKLLDAWKTLIVPFAESARVGEYLRARDHGAPVLDALYAAKHVTANFQQRGGFTAMRGLDRASMFLNPALQGLDQATFRAGVNPFRVPEEGRQAAAAKYLSKAFIGITLPSMYFWFLNKDDKEINDLRKTQSGAKYWFMRSPVDQGKMGLKKGDIVKIPKPIVDGQMFGTSMEAYLDKAYGDDPAQMAAAVGAMSKDISFNVLPTAGVLYYGLQFNQNVGLDSPLIPGGDEKLALEHRGEDRASWVSRAVSQKASPLVSPTAPAILQNALTPAGIDYVMNTVGGMLGQDALLAVTQAVDAETKGYVPAKEELPIIQKIFAAYPSTNVMPLRRFYDRAGQVQTVGATMDHLAREDPTRLAAYMTSNQADYTLIGVMTKARQDIANFRRAYEDIKNMPAGALPQEDRRTILKQYQVLMIETARQANVFSTEVDKMMKH